MKISDCCGASIVEETDVCSECEEHCVVITNDGFEIYDKIEAQHSALIYLASNCDDNGLAMCLENVCDSLVGVMDHVIELTGDNNRLKELFDKTSLLYNAGHSLYMKEQRRADTAEATIKELQAVYEYDTSSGHEVSERAKVTDTITPIKRKVMSGGRIQAYNEAYYSEELLNELGSLGEFVLKEKEPYLILNGRDIALHKRE